MLAGKVVVVTGVTTGLGKAIVRTFAAAGAAVVGTGRREALGRELESEIAAAGGTMMFVAADLRNVADCDRVIAAAADRFGGLDVLVNNAAARSDPPLLALERVDEENWDNVLGTNLKAAFFCTRAAVAPMRERGGGLVLNIASFLAEQAIAGMTAYSVSKAGLVQLTRMAAVELAPDGIRSNAIILGSTDTGQAERIFAEERTFRPTAAEAQSGRGPIPSMAPDDVARAIALLCSDDARLVTGATIAIDGGVTAGLLTSMWVHDSMA